MKKLLKTNGGRTSYDDYHCRRDIAMGIGLMCCVGLGLSVNYDVSALGLGDVSTINPVYQKYMNDVVAGKGDNWRIIPEKYTVYGDLGGYGDFASLPAAYNLIDEGYGTQIKNQGHEGICWAYALTTAMESHLKKTEGINTEFSAKQLDYLISEYTPYGDYLERNFDYTHELGGGSNIKAVSFALNGAKTPINEAVFYNKLAQNDTSGKLRGYSSYREYADENGAENLFGINVDVYNSPLSEEVIMGENSDYIVTEHTSYVGDRDFVNKVKNEVYNNGAVFVSTYAPDIDTDCWDVSTNTIVDNGVTTCGSDNGHAMAIVGWDDSHIYTNPLDGTRKTGAFIVQNSYGVSSMFEDYGLSADEVMGLYELLGMLEGKTDEEKAGIRTAVQNEIDNYNAYEYVYLGYDFDDSGENGTIGFTSIQEMRRNEYAKVYDLTSEVDGFGGNYNTEDEALVYNYSTGDAKELIKGIGIGTHAAFTIPITLSVQIDDGSGFRDYGSVVMPAGMMGQRMIEPANDVAVSGVFKVKLSVLNNDQVLSIGDYFVPYFTANVLAVNDESNMTPVPDPAGVTPASSLDNGGQNIGVPNTGESTMDALFAKFGGVMVIGTVLALGLGSVVVVKNRKTLFCKVGFTKK